MVPLGPRTVQEESYDERRRRALLKRLERLRTELVVVHTGVRSALVNHDAYGDAAAMASQLSVAADDLAGVLQELDLLPRERRVRVDE